MEARRRPKSKLTRREMRLLKAILRGATAKDAAIEAGYSPKYARQSASQALANVQRKAPELFARHGLDDDSFIDKHILPALAATEVKAFQSDGEIIYSKPMKAWGAKIRAIELVARMKGMMISIDEIDDEAEFIGIEIARCFDVGNV